MTTTEQLREIHITILKAINQAEALQDNPDFEYGSYQRDYAFKMVHELECVIFNQLHDIKDYLDIEYAPIEKEEVL